MHTDFKLDVILKGFCVVTQDYSCKLQGPLNEVRSVVLALRDYPFRNQLATVREVQLVVRDPEIGGCPECSGTLYFEVFM